MQSAPRLPLMQHLELPAGNLHITNSYWVVWDGRNSCHIVFSTPGPSRLTWKSRASEACYALVQEHYSSCHSYGSLNAPESNPDVLQRSSLCLPMVCMCQTLLWAPRQSFECPFAHLHAQGHPGAQEASAHWSGIDLRCLTKACLTMQCWLVSIHIEVPLKTGHQGRCNCHRCV
jgi:hypothetical protein